MRVMEGAEFGWLRKQDGSDLLGDRRLSNSPAGRFDDTLIPEDPVSRVELKKRMIMMIQAKLQNNSQNNEARQSFFLDAARVSVSLGEILGEIIIQGKRGK